jgi:hypothetical protein
MKYCLKGVDKRGRTGYSECAPKAPRQKSLIKPSDYPANFLRAFAANQIEQTHNINT